ncbi:hypothetical protein IL54_2737 [Sphingobium sp. ba1]|nr:hypothetical protein IL54_2737 [Sphingobium sp. ba1]
MILNGRDRDSKLFTDFSIGQILYPMHEEDLPGLVGETIDGRLVETHDILPFDSEALLRGSADFG